MTEIVCPSCENVYKSDNSITEHFSRNPACKRWYSLLNGSSIIAKLVQETSNRSKTEYAMKNSMKKHLCNSCGLEYCNLGNLNKHLKSHIACIKYNSYSMLSNTELTEDELENDGINIGIVPENYINDDYVKVPEKEEGVPEFIFIIWNLLLTDKVTINEAISSNSITPQRSSNPLNNVSHIIAIVPERSVVNFESIDKYNILKYDFSRDKYTTYDVLEYGIGHDILTQKQLDEFEVMYDKMEAFQKERKNVLILCNSGYQRSLPFLCRYLTTRHPNEVKSMKQALTIVLGCIKQLDLLDSMLEAFETIFGN